MQRGLDLQGKSLHLRAHGLVQGLPHRLPRSTRGGPGHFDHKDLCSWALRHADGSCSRKFWGSLLLPPPWFSLCVTSAVGWKGAASLLPVLSFRQLGVPLGSPWVGREMAPFGWQPEAQPGPPVLLGPGPGLEDAFSFPDCQFFFPPSFPLKLDISLSYRDRP